MSVRLISQLYPVAMSAFGALLAGAILVFSRPDDVHWHVSNSQG